MLHSARPTREDGKENMRAMSTYLRFGFFFVVVNAILDGSGWNGSDVSAGGDCSIALLYLKNKD